LAAAILAAALYVADTKYSDKIIPIAVGISNRIGSIAADNSTATVEFVRYQSGHRGTLTVKGSSHPDVELKKWLAKEENQGWEVDKSINPSAPEGGIVNYYLFRK
jgi:hypothetical protein